MYKVVIKPKHTGGGFSNIEDCPLYRAIKEQLPEFPLSHVGVYWVYDLHGELYDIKGTWSFFGSLLYPLLYLRIIWWKTVKFE